MKNVLRLLMIPTCFLVLSTQASAATPTDKAADAAVADSGQMEKDFDNLGGNRIFLEKAKALNPETTTTVVQDRIVDRVRRFELSGEYANTFGGDTYVRTGTFGVNGQFHINNNWSVGARYGMSYNKLTAEGDDLVARAISDHQKNPSSSTAPVPDIDYPKNIMMGFVNFYPLYGKISWLGKSVTHFDVYGQLGYGTMSLKSGSAPVLSGGGGIGLWWNQNMTTRLQMNYLDYTAQYYNGSIKQGITTASLQIGWLM